MDKLHMQNWSGQYGISSVYISLAARGLAQIPPNQVIDDFGRGSSVESESEWCPAGIIERF